MFINIFCYLIINIDYSNYYNRCYNTHILHVCYNHIHNLNVYYIRFVLWSCYNIYIDNCNNNYSCSYCHKNYCYLNYYFRNRSHNFFCIYPIFIHPFWTHCPIYLMPCPKNLCHPKLFFSYITLGDIYDYTICCYDCKE